MSVRLVTPTDRRVGTTATTSRQASDRRTREWDPSPGSRRPYADEVAGRSGHGLSIDSRNQTRCLSGSSPQPTAGWGRLRQPPDKRQTGARGSGTPPLGRDGPTRMRLLAAQAMAYRSIHETKHDVCPARHPNRPPGGDDCDNLQTSVRQAHAGVGPLPWV